MAIQKSEIERDAQELKQKMQGTSTEVTRLQVLRSSQHQSFVVLIQLAAGGAAERTGKKSEAPGRKAAVRNTQRKTPRSS
jgi:hypothetical protein